jgi:Tol biopolymer transport system component
MPLSNVVFTLFFLFVLLSGSCTRGKTPPGVHVYYLSKREGYYGLARSDLRRAEDLYTSRTVLEKYPNMARYHVSYDVSPDEASLAFAGLSERGAMDIFVLDLRTRILKNITDDANVDSCPLFSGDSRLIAYLSHEPGGRHYDNIVLIERDGSGRKLITRGCFRILSMEFFPGDDELLFVKYIPFHSAVAKVDLTSGRVADLTGFADANRSASVSPDGSMIVYASDRNGSYDVWIMRSDGSNNRVLYESPGHEYEPQFVANGGKVLFVSDFVPEKAPGRMGNSIYSIDTDGSHQRSLLPLRNMREDFFCRGLVPVGKGDQIYFEGRYVEGRNRAPSVYLLDVSSDRVRRIIREANAVADLAVFPR